MQFATKVSKLWDNYNKKTPKLGQIMANYAILWQHTNYNKNTKSNSKTVESQLCLKEFMRSQPDFLQKG